MSGWCSTRDDGMMKFNRIWLFIGLAVIIMPTLSSCSSRDKENFSEAKWVKTIEETRVVDLHAPHHRGGRFFSPWMEMTDKSIPDVLGWKLFSKHEYCRSSQRV